MVGLLVTGVGYDRQGMAGTGACKGCSRPARDACRSDGGAAVDGFADLRLTISNCKLQMANLH